jgi:hypothetical protein
MDKFEPNYEEIRDFDMYKIIVDDKYEKEIVQMSSKIDEGWFISRGGKLTEGDFESITFTGMNEYGHLGHGEFTGVKLRKIPYKEQAREYKYFNFYEFTYESFTGWLSMTQVQRLKRDLNVFIVPGGC